MTVNLRIEYGNGAMKEFANLKPPPNRTVANLLTVATELAPGVDFDFDGSTVDRGGNSVGVIRAIDGVGADGEDRGWRIIVNGVDKGSETRRSSGSSLGAPSEFHDGDQVLLKFA